MGSKDQRVDARHEVRLQVRYAVAQEFVVEYAQNLSQGGLFIAGAHELAPLTEVTVDVSLPGAGTHSIIGEVAHVITPEAAAKLNRSPGAGIAIKRAPKGFKEDLAAYLVRLGRRADVMIWCVHDQVRATLRRAGYQVVAAPPPEAFALAMVRSPVPVMAVVVAAACELVYRQAVSAAGGADDMVVVVDAMSGLDRVLETLDALL